MADVLARIVSPFQSGFVKDRSIIENVLLTQEMCHGMRAKNEDVILKLDMTKAYDNMSWSCVLAVLKKFGFCEKWVVLVDRTINNIWYSVIVNGEQQGFFHSSRGLRQGDPLSPSLFVVAAELLSALLRQKEASFTQPEGGPQIHHLAFADDLIVFTCGKGEAIQGTMRAIEYYESVSGQLVNKNKSAFYVHEKTSGEVVRKVGRLIGYQNKKFPFVYLGCPIYVGRKRVALFANLI